MVNVQSCHLLPVSSPSHIPTSIAGHASSKQEESFLSFCHFALGRRICDHSKSFDHRKLLLTLSPLVCSYDIFGRSWRVNSGRHGHIPWWVRTISDIDPNDMSIASPSNYGFFIYAVRFCVVCQECGLVLFCVEMYWWDLLFKYLSICICNCISCWKS